jgi:hypothetical protein
MLTVYKTACALSMCETAADPSSSALQIATALWDSSMSASSSTDRSNYITHCQQYANAIASIHRYRLLKDSMNSLLGELTPSSLEAFEKLRYELQSLRSVSERYIDYYITRHIGDAVISRAFSMDIDRKKAEREAAAAATGGAA